MLFGRCFMAVQAQTGIFDTVSKRDVFGFYNKGQIQYREIAKTLDLKRKEISRAARVATNSVRYEEDRIPDNVKDLLTSMEWLLNVTYRHFKDKNKVIQWFNSPNPICGGASPKDMICMGQYKKLVKIVNSYVEGDIP